MESPGPPSPGARGLAHSPSGRKDHACQRVHRAAGSRGCVGCVCVMRGFGLAFPESCSLGPWSFPTPVTLGLQGVPVGGRRPQLLAVRRHSHFQQPSREDMVRDCLRSRRGSGGSQVSRGPGPTLSWHMLPSFWAKLRGTFEVCREAPEKGWSQGAHAPTLGACRRACLYRSRSLSGLLSMAGALWG